MSPFRRMATFVVLITLVLNLGDWPYLDEIIDGLVAQQAAVQAQTAGDAAHIVDKSSPDPSNNPGIDFQGLLAMVQFLPQSDSVNLTAPSGRRAIFAALLVPRADFIQGGRFRPPAA